MVAKTTKPQKAKAPAKRDDTTDKPVTTLAHVDANTTDADPDAHPHQHGPGGIIS